MRYSTVPAQELAPILGLTAEHIRGDWLTRAEWNGPPTDADGNPIQNCVFADTDTGLVVIQDQKPAPGVFPFRCENRKPPISPPTVQAEPPADQPEPESPKPSTSKRSK